MNHEVSYAVSGLSCSSCVDAITKKLTASQGVEGVRIEVVEATPRQVKLVRLSLPS